MRVYASEISDSVSTSRIVVPKGGHLRLEQFLALCIFCSSPLQPHTPDFTLKYPAPRSRTSHSHWLSPQQRTAANRSRHTTLERSSFACGQCGGRDRTAQDDGSLMKSSHHGEEVSAEFSLFPFLYFLLLQSRAIP